MKIIYVHLVDPTGATYAIPVEDTALGKTILLPEIIYLTSEGGSPATMAGDFAISFDGDLPQGQKATFTWKGGMFTIGDNNFEVWGTSLTQAQLDVDGSLEFTAVDGEGIKTTIYIPNFGAPDSISGLVLVDKTVLVGKLTPGADGQVAATEGTDVVWQKIINKNIDVAAGITRSKTAVGTANYLVTNNGSGVMSEQETATFEQGGFENDMSAVEGFVVFTGGAIQTGVLIENRAQRVSFNVSSQGDNYFYFDYPVIVTKARCAVDETIASTDEGELIFKDGSGNVMDGSGISSGFLPIPADSTVGTVITTSLTTNNEIVAGSYLKITNSKATPGGAVNVTLTIERLRLS